MPQTAPPTVPLWRRALARVWATLKVAVAWVYTRLKAAGGAVWSKVRDPKLSTARRVAWGAGGVVGAGALAGAALAVGLLFYGLVLWPLTPSVGDLRNAREVDPAVVLSADGTELTRFARRNREWRTLDEISPHVVEALVATEDRRFYAHSGLDALGVGGAAADALTGRGLRGASTLTQQLARNLFPDAIGNAPSVSRKMKEAVTALKIERVYTKDQILELYLNTVPFLYNAWGIEMAARTYFSTSAGDLDRLQAATLVGMLKGTSSYNPYRNPDRALARRNVVLGQLVAYGDLSEAEAAALRDEPLGLKFERQPMQRSLAPHFTEHVRVQLEGWADEAGYSLYGDGLTVHTTLDWRLQKAAAAAVETFGDALQTVADVEWGRASADRLGPTTAPYVRVARQTQPFERFWTLRREAADAFVAETAAYRAAVAGGAAPDDALAALRADPAFLDSLRQEKMRLEVALAAVDPSTGEVRVWVGGRDFRDSAYDHVGRAKRQPGSTFKPFLYARALEEGFEPDDEVPDDDVEITLDNGVVWTPTNAGGAASGELVSLRDGLAQSKNTVAARLVEEVGARDLARTARRMGIQSKLDAVPSLALGTSDVSLLEMTSAYATIADGGVYRAPVTVTHITDRDGNEVARFAPPPRPALDPDVATDLLDMMRGVVDVGTGSDVRRRFGARGDLAGKTGTTQDGADGWFLLMHPDLVMGAWVGFDDPRVTFRSSYWGQGGHNALRVVGDFYRRAERDRLVDRAAVFPRPAPRSDDGDGVFERFASAVADWAGGLFERGGERVADAWNADRRDGADLPDGYGPRTPNRAGWRPDRADDRPARRDDHEERDEADETLYVDSDWVEDILDLDRIEDPRVRREARRAVRQAVREANRGAGDGLREIRRARDEAVRDARREVERAREDAERGGPLFEDEEVEDEGGFVVDEPVEGGVGTPEAAPPVPPRAPGRESVPRAAGRIGW
ncbi:transglycosylase domain-containing protein [Rubrivirga sp. S365]|uniref:peptidoglycan glycosyltransferase n=1 Tax=Rubrivirga litoralis TaxID=3075598 RepID=A0ABU3BM49_9BACT|nr:MULTISPECIES: transglycosylase domain-containing protein [unclassified Rubrivirga]MDT0630353.1 transglycosylase domain-containing protein [Rubrivirga sp. F394]MDT7855864.1 transglycosylase domain-containing protein [Rubrivirga sp. S365]